MKASLQPLVCLLFLMACTSATAVACGDYIFGCTECAESTAGSAASYTCQRCEPNLYLYKYFSSYAKTYLNICVPSCPDADHNTVGDHINMQCIYLGPFCGYSGVTNTNNAQGAGAGGQSISTGPQQQSPMCQYSYLDDKGFVLGSRYEIIKWLTTETYINTDQTFTKSLTELRQKALEYEAPLQTTPIAQQPAEYNVKVVAKCESVYCNLCESYNLTSCVTCWGRFADLTSYASCRTPRRTCHVLTTPDPDFRIGCYQNRADCTGCDICDYGWAQRTNTAGLNYCYNCTEIHPNCTECEAQNPATATTPATASPTGGTVACMLCSDGWGVRGGNCSRCTVAHVKHCTFDSTTGLEEPLLCADGYILDRTNTTCKRVCDHHEFPAVDFNTTTHTVTRTFCQDCDPACRSCARDGPDQCLTCKGQTYLQLPTSYARKGPCVNKTKLNSTSPLSQREIHVVVLNVNNAEVKDQYPGDFRIQQSFMAAIYQTYKQATETIGANVTVFLESGDHYVTKTYMDQYIMDKAEDVGVDWTNPEFHLTIKPLDCTDVSQLSTAYRSTACRTSSTPKYSVRLFNKVGAHFHIQVPQRLQWEGIYMDSFDSLVKYYSPTTNNLGQDCQWTNDREYSCQSVNNADLMIEIDTNPICAHRSYDSIFQMKTIDRNVTTHGHIHQLEIKDSAFVNIFYEMGSIVRLPRNINETWDGNTTAAAYEWPWHLAITGSEFLNMSFCGSVVSNDYPLFSGTANNPITYFNDGLQKQIKSYYGPSTSEFMLLDCSAPDTACHDLVFTNNTIQNHFMLKSPGNGSPYFTQKVNWQMLKFGLVLHLNHFKGNITIAQNQINDVRINFNDICTYYEPLSQTASPNSATFDMTATTAWTKLENFYSIYFDKKTQYLIPMQNSIHQVISLIVVDNFKDGQWVNITDNQFNRNIVGNSLISISQAVNTVRNSSYSRYQGEVIIKNNIFNESAAYIGTNAITITKQDNSNVTNKVDIYNYCGRGIYITNNTFRRVVGTCQTDTGLVRIQCNNTDFAEQISQHFNFVNITRQISPAQGRMAKVFNSTSLETLRPRFTADPKNDATIISGNTIINCSSGIAQQSMTGVFGYESTYIESLQGSLFAISDVLLLEFSNNVFEGVYPVNDLLFYQMNSPHYQFFKQQTVRSTTGLKVQNQLINNDQSAAILTTMNVYELHMHNVSFWHVKATKFKDAVIFYSQSGMKNISITSSTFIDVAQVDKLFFKSIDVSYLDLVSVEMYLNHTVTLKDLVIDMVSIKPSATPYASAIIYDNFHGEFTIKDFSMQNVSLTNVVFDGDLSSSDPQIPSGLLYVAANSLSLSQLNFQNLTLYQKLDTGNPIRLQIYNFTGLEVARPKLEISNSTFRNINFTCLPALAVTETMGAKGGLLTFFHDALQYDVEISDTIFDGIQMLFQFNPNPAIDFKPTVTTVLQTRQTNFTDLYVAGMAMTIKNSILKDVYQTQTEQVKQQLFNFKKPIANLYLDGNQFIGIERQWHLFDAAALLDNAFTTTTNTKAKGMVQVMQTFNPATGPQQVFIMNTVFSTSRIQPRDMIRQKQIKDPNYSGPPVKHAAISIDTVETDKSARYFFDFRNYSYTAPATATSSAHYYRKPSQFAHFKNVTVSNIDFNHQVNDIPRAGSFIRSMQSNIILDGIVATNLSSKANGTFLQVLDTLDEDATVEIVPNATSISIKNSRFTNCTSKVGGVIYYHNQEPKNIQSMTITDADFIANYANSSGVMYIYASNQTFAFTAIAMDENMAGTNNSIGSIINNGNNTVVFDRVQVSNGQALNGTNSMLFQDTSVSMSNVRFSDNFATIGASNIKFAGAYAPGYTGTQPSLLIRNSTFESSQYYTLGLKQVFGAYLNIGYSAQAKSTDYFGPKITVQDSSFRLGSARGGGAIYAAGLNSINMAIEDSTFDNNKAYINGGTIMFDELDEYLITINRTDFAYNLGRKYGDNFYARQTKSTKALSTRRRMLPAAAGTVAAAPQRTIKMDQINQTTPLTYNQMYFEGIQTLELNAVTFNKVLDSQALEGASIYCLNCYKLLISNSSFVGQSALIRGGAVFLRQNTSTNFGQPWTGAVHSINTSKFINCSSQQGAALYTKFVHNSVIDGKNVFEGNEALLYDQELHVQTSLDGEVKKASEPLTDQSRRGKGPAVYFECTFLSDSRLSILEGAQFLDSKVYDVALGKDVESTGANHTIVKALYYTQCEPIVPASLSNLVEQSFVVSYIGTNGVFFANQTEYDAFAPIMMAKLKEHETLNYVVQHPLAVTDNKEFRKHYGLDDFKVRSTTIFGDLPIAIVDDHVNGRNEVQIYDDFSLLTLELEDKTSATGPIPAMLLQEGKNATTRALFKATHGIIQVPKLQIQATPDQELNLKINFTIFNSNSSSFTTVINDVVFKSQACSAGEVINTNGTCQVCSGPSYYLLEPVNQTTASGAVHVQDCSTCNQTVMTCKGGANLSSNVGYQRLNVHDDLFIKCGQIHNSSTCLAENRCEEGYQGLMCKECSPNYYRDFDGQCQQCSLSSDGRDITYSDGTYTLFSMAFNVIIVILAVKFVTELALSGQSKNSISSGFYLFKNIANYVIFFVLLSQIFSIYWTRKGHDPNTHLKSFVETMRAFYRIPLMTSDYQCYHNQKVVIYDAADNANVVVPLMTTDAVAAQVALSKETKLDRRTIQLIVMASVTTTLLIITTLKNTLCPPKTPGQQEAAKLQGQVTEKMQEQQDMEKSKARAMLKERHDDQINRNNAEFEEQKLTNPLYQQLDEAQLALADRASYSVTNAGDIQSNYESAYSRATSNAHTHHSHAKLLDRGAFDSRRLNAASSQQLQLPKGGVDVIGLSGQELGLGGDMQYEVQSQHQTRHLQESMHPQLQRDGLYAASMDLRSPASALLPQAGIGSHLQGANGNLGRGQGYQQYEGGEQDHQDIRESRRARTRPRQQEVESIPGSSPVAGRSQINIQNLNYVVQNDNSMRMVDEQGVNFFAQQGRRPPPIQAPDERKTPFFDESNPKGVSRTDPWRQNAQTPPPRNGRPRSEHPGGVPTSGLQQQPLGREQGLLNMNSQIAKSKSLRYVNENSAHEKFGQQRLQSVIVAPSPSKILHPGQYPEHMRQQKLEGGRAYQSAYNLAEQQAYQQSDYLGASGQLQQQRTLPQRGRPSNVTHADDVSQRSLVTDQRSGIGGRSARSRRTDVSTNSGRRKIREKRAEAAEQKEKTWSKLRRYQFHASTIAVMVLAFMMNTQITQQFVMYLACQDVEYAGPPKDSKAVVAFNYYDSAMVCDSSAVASAGTVICFLGYVLVWVVLAPSYLLLKSSKEFIIEYFGLIVKLVLVIVAQFAPFMTEFQVGVAGAFLVTLQLLIFMIFRSGQVSAESQKVVKLQELNTIDFSMYLTLCLTGYISLVFIIFDLDVKIEKMLYLVILAINVLYLFFWLAKVARYGFKHLKATPKLAHVYICLTCDYFGEQPKTRQEKGKEMQELNEIEEIRNQDLEKIDILIEHLQDVQKSIITKKEKPGEEVVEDAEGEDGELDTKSAAVRRGFINQSHLLDEIDEILNPAMESGRGETHEDESNVEPIFVQSGRDFDLQSQMVVQQSQLVSHVPGAAGHSDRVYSHDDMDSDDDGARIQFQHGGPPRGIARAPFDDRDGGVDEDGQGARLGGTFENVLADSPMRNFQAADFQSPESFNKGQREANQFSLARSRLDEQAMKEADPEEAPADDPGPNPFEKDAARQHPAQDDQVQANYFNDTFSKHEIQNSLKQIQQEGDEQKYPQIQTTVSELLKKLQGIDYPHARAKDQHVMAGMVPHGQGGLEGSPGVEAMGPGEVAEPGAERQAPAAVEVQTEIQKVLAQLSHLDAGMKQKPGFDAGELSASLRISQGHQEAAAADDGRFLRGVGPAGDAEATGDATGGSPDANPADRGRTATQKVMDDLDGLTAGMRARQPGYENRGSTLKDFLEPESQASPIQSSLHEVFYDVDDGKYQPANANPGNTDQARNTRSAVRVLKSQRSLTEESGPASARRRAGSPRLDSQPSGEKVEPDDTAQRAAERELVKKKEEQQQRMKEQTKELMKVAMKKKLAGIMDAKKKEIELLKKKRLELKKASQKSAQGGKKGPGDGAEVPGESKK